MEFNKVEIPIELTKNININISDTTDEIIRWSFVKHEREFIELLGASVPKLYEKVFSIVSVSFDCENGKLKTIIYTRLLNNEKFKFITFMLIEKLRELFEKLIQEKIDKIAIEIINGEKDYIAASNQVISKQYFDFKKSNKR
ncbi:MAG: hypothetical protein IPL42_02015 [Saprospiraceae bacterium]|nr:hypothetical protein [Saprospiraceae bacterium]